MPNFHAVQYYGSDPCITLIIYFSEDVEMYDHMQFEAVIVIYIIPIAADKLKARSMHSDLRFERSSIFQL